MTSVDRDAILRAAQELLTAADIDVVLVPGRTAASLAGPLRQLFEEERRRNAARIPAEMLAALDTFEDARRRRDKRAAVPKSEHAEAEQPEHAARSPHVGREELTTREAADRLRVDTDRAVTAAIGRGRLPARKVGGRWLIDPEDLIEYQESTNGHSHRSRTQGGE